MRATGFTAVLPTGRKRLSANVYGAAFRPSLTRPDALGTDWQVEFSVIPVTPNFVAKWLK